MVIGLATLVAPAHALEPDEATDYLQNPARTGSLAGDWLEPPLVHRWTSEELGSPISFPLIAEDRVFVTARRGDAGVALFALDRATGEVLWSDPLGGASWIGDPAYGDGRVFVVGGSGVIHAFAADSGEPLWSRSVFPSFYSSWVPPTVVGRQLVAGFSNDRLVALDAESGETLWFGAAEGAGITPAAADVQRAYVADACGNVTAHDLGSGRLSWRRRSGFSCGGGTDVAVHRGRLYVQDSEGDAGLVLDASTGAPLTASVANHPLSLTGDLGLFATGTAGTHLEARDVLDGNLAWELTLPEGEGVAFPPVVVGDDVFLAREPDSLSAHDLATGATEWSAVLGGDLLSCCLAHPTQGFAAGQGTLIAPSGNRLDAYGRAGPDTWIDERPPKVSTATDETFTFGSPTLAAQFDCSFDEGPWTPCVSPVSRTGLPEGEHSFRVRASTVADDPDPSPAQRIWRVDVTPPDTSLDGAPPELVASPNAVFEFSSPEAGVDFECALDAADWSPCASPQPYADLPDGPHHFEVRAVDGAGSPDPTPEIWSWEVDTTPPVTSLTVVPRARSTSREATFEFSSSAPDTTGFECRLDGAAWSSCVSPATYSGLADGVHEFEVAALDEAGNRDETPARREWRVEPPPPDTLPPYTDLHSRPPARTRDRTATFRFSAFRELDAAFECRLDGGEWRPCTSPTFYSALALGLHTFEVRGVDAAGNRDPTPASHSWTIDAPPAPAAPRVQDIPLFTDLTPSASRILRRGVKATVVLPGPGWSVTGEVRDPSFGSSPGRLISRVRRTSIPAGRIRLRLRPRRSARALVRPGARLLLEVSLRPPFGQAIPLRRALTLGR